MRRPPRTGRLPLLPGLAHPTAWLAFADPGAPAGAASRPTDDGLARLLDAVSDAIVALDGQGRIVYVNRAAIEMSRMPEGDLLGSVLWRVFPSVEGSLLEVEIRQAMASRGPAVTLMPYEPYGIWVEIRIHPTADGVLLFVRDVSAERQHAETLELQAAVIHEVDNAILSVDAQGRITSWNRGAEQLYGWAPEEAVGRNADEILPLSDGAGERLDVHPDDRSTVEGHVRHRDGRVLSVLSTTVPRYDEAGGYAGWLAVHTDVTERRAIERVTAAERTRTEMLLSVGPAVIYSDRPAPGYPSNFFSPSARTVLGLDPEDLVDDRFLGRVHPEDRARVAAEIATILDRGQFVQEYRFLHGDGHYRWLRDESRVLRDDDGTPREIVGYIADVTAQRTAELDRFRLAAAIDQTNDGVLLLDDAGAAIYANESVERIMGLARDEFLARPAVLLEAVDAGPGKDAAIEALSNAGRWRGMLSGVRPDGTAYDAEVNIWPLVDEDGRTINVVAVMRDVTRERGLTAAVEQHSSERSELIAALRRIRPGATAEATAAAILDEVTRVDGIHIGVVFGFVNGNRVITLGSAGRVPDLHGFEGVSPACARYLRRRTEEGTFIEDAYQHQRNHIEAECSWDRLGLTAIQSIPLESDGLTIGALVIGSNEPEGARRLTDVGALLHEYGALTSALLAPGINERREASDLSVRIEAIIGQRSFSTVLQPVVELATRTVVGHEALTRFEHGEPPDQTFEKAISVGLGLDLEEATLRRALESVQTLTAATWLSVNVSPSMVLSGRLPAILAARGSRHVVLEITEHALIDNYVAIRAAVKAVGPWLELAVDDAGAGYSSLRHVVELRPRYVKLDAGLVRGVNRDPVRQGLIAGMVHFAAETSCVLIAEGIETEAERRALRRLGVTFGQGFLLGRPAPPGVD